MRVIDTTTRLASALAAPMDQNVKRLLAVRRDQLGGDIYGGAHFYILEPRDTIAEVEAAIGFPLTDEGEPSFDWIESHSGIIEICYIMSDDGPAHVLLVPPDNINPALLAIIRTFASEDANLDRSDVAGHTGDAPRA